MPTRRWQGQRVLVTGGSGTIGARLVERLLELDAGVVRVFGRDETKQFYQRQRHRGRWRPALPRSATSATATGSTRAMEGIDVVFHCAALKHVESGEYNPFEATQTNVVGTQNVIDACLAADVGTMILTSSDKAANPTSVMGAIEAARREAGQRRDELPRPAPRRRSPASGSATSWARAGRRSSCSPARSRPAAR